MQPISGDRDGVPWIYHITSLQKIHRHGFRKDRHKHHSVSKEIGPRFTNITE